MTSPGHISAFLGYSHRAWDLSGTCFADVSVNTCAVNTSASAAPVLYSTFYYCSTVTYTCQDG